MLSAISMDKKVWIMENLQERVTSDLVQIHIEVHTDQPEAISRSATICKFFQLILTGAESFFPHYPRSSLLTPKITLVRPWWPRFMT